MGKEDVLVMTDVFTKYTQAVATRERANTVAKVLIQDWFHRFGVPDIPIQCAFKIRHSLINVKDVEKKLHRTLWDSCDRRLFQQVNPQ